MTIGDRATITAAYKVLDRARLTPPGTFRPESCPVGDWILVVGDLDRGAEAVLGGRSVRRADTLEDVAGLLSCGWLPSGAVVIGTRDHSTPASIATLLRGRGVPFLLAESGRPVDRRALERWAGGLR